MIQSPASKPPQAFVQWWQSEWGNADGIELSSGARIETDAAIQLDWVSDSGRCWRAALASAEAECRSRIAAAHEADARLAETWDDCQDDCCGDIAAAIRERAKE